MACVCTHVPEVALAMVFARQVSLSTSSEGVEVTLRTVCWLYVIVNQPLRCLTLRCRHTLDHALLYNMREYQIRAKVAELVDALVLGASGGTRESSNLSFRTITDSTGLTNKN